MPVCVFREIPLSTRVVFKGLEPKEIGELACKNVKRTMLFGIIRQSYLFTSCLHKKNVLNSTSLNSALQL